MRVLVIGGIEIPVSASHQLSQDYEPIQAVDRGRFMSGTAYQQTAWSGKTRTIITGGGIMPSGIQGLDFSNAITIKGGSERVLYSAGTNNVFAIPPERRTDYGVEGKALVDGKWVSTAVSMAANVATLTIVAGATQYQAIYWPELICFLDTPSDNRDLRRSVYGWTITAEEK